MSVFISYAIGDKSRIKKVIRKLMSQGIVDEGEKVTDISDIDPGSSVRLQVRSAIEAASKVVVVWSDTGSGSDWVNYEAGMAEALGKPIFVVVPKGQGGRLPHNFADTQIIELD